MYLYRIMEKRHKRIMTQNTPEAPCLMLVSTGFVSINFKIIYMFYCSEGQGFKHISKFV